MDLNLENPRIKIRNSRTLKQCCIVCDKPIAHKDEDGNIVPRKIISVGNTPGSGKIAFSKNLHIHVECADAFAEQIRYAAALENPERILSYDVLPEDD